MIEIVETFHPTPRRVLWADKIVGGGVLAVQTAHLSGLPQGMRCLLAVRADGWTFRTTRANGAGSTRYDQHRTYGEAVEAAMRWAKRKVAEAARETAKAA